MWEAMLVTYLATRFTVLPFDGIATLVKNSNFKIAVAPGTSQNDAFKLSTDPLWMEAWQERIEPFQEGYSAIPSKFYQIFKKELRNSPNVFSTDSELHKIVLENPSFAFYSNYFQNL